MCVRAQARARYKILKRKRDNMDAARDVLGRTEIGEHSRGRSPVSVGNQGHRSRSFSRGPDRGGPGEPGLEVRPPGCPQPPARLWACLRWWTWPQGAVRTSLDIWPSLVVHSLQWTWPGLVCAPSKLMRR